MDVDKKFSLIAVLLVSSALTACDRKPQEWSADGPTRYCVDKQGRRVPDDQCGRSHAGGGVSPFLWYYLGSMAGRRSYVPAMGGPAAGGGYAPMGGVRYGAPTFGGRGASGVGGVARGGFGATGAGMGAGE